MSTLTMIGIDLVAMTLLALPLYWRRHKRADLVAAFIRVNIGVLAVTMILTQATVSTGLGLGLFGVLSIIRLRSSEISQREVAYYFASLSIGLLSGMAGAPDALTIGLIALILAALAIADSLLLGSQRSQQVQLDRAIADEKELVAELEARLGADVLKTRILKIDLVNDLTLVEVHSRAA
ncbi:DUF4956 domain-containing protein [Schaalia hyovaginalis]|uniref:DUF4956 domain-containing protein n=1 Tax=Schaalia hyovaginalis TaxID=29316 RepID=A0A923E079_9ACTO|nr:DUF4956 domain-containing protein [Schaalia hyovaginalis]MBB6333508.1 hypothetical protein [Schaalia hyovaginalis]MDY2669034.1 DUF4956 domain-containing protein [Schaalia hyovaginalis]